MIPNHSVNALNTDTKALPEDRKQDLNEREADLRAKKTSMAKGISKQASKDRGANQAQKRELGVMHRPTATGVEDSLLTLHRTAGNRAVGQLLRAYQPTDTEHDQSVAQSNFHLSHAEDHPPPFAVKREELTSLLGQGRSLPADVGSQLTSRYGDSFSDVRIHDDSVADHVSRSLGAEALSVGEHIAFRRGRYNPSTLTGRELLVHEAQHIASERTHRGSAARSPVQRKVSVEDVTEEMRGLSFTVRSDQGTAPHLIPKGSSVVVTDWKGTGSRATVEYNDVAKSRTIRLDVPKLALEPTTPSEKGVRHYKTSLAEQRTAVEKAQTGVEEQTKNVEDWKTKESKYKKNRTDWEKSLKSLEDELTRRQDILKRKEVVLSNMLIQATMYNRFDPIIAKWVIHYNKDLKPDTDLDPNIVKSMLFQESRMGTSGEHLEKPPYSWASGTKHPIRSRFNIGQAIDSSGPQQLLMIREMSPTIYKKYKLDELEKEDKSKGKTEKEFWEWRAGDFGKAVQEFHQKDPATSKNLMGTSDKELYEDYNFWIRTSVRWLFHKYFSLSKPNWPEAVRAYNGSGPGARAYKRKVMARVGSTSDLDVSGK